MKLRAGRPGWSWPLIVLLAVLLAWVQVWVQVAAAAVVAEAPPDPPGRVGRVAQVEGAVWWYETDTGRWLAAPLNRPVTAGDRLGTSRGAAAVLQIGSTRVRLDEASELELQRLDDERVQLVVHRGRIAVRVRSTEVARETWLGTPEAWLQPLRSGLYRIDREGESSFATAWRGELRVHGVGQAADAATAAGHEAVVDTGVRVRLWRDASALRLEATRAPDDAFAARVLAEAVADDRDDERAPSRAYVSAEMTGWEDLDRHGRWDQHPELGAVWFPTRVAAGWAPYREGQWTWIDPWGWTWVDQAPWGFTPFHYGRWVHWRHRWGWVPGRYEPRPVFESALVHWGRTGFDLRRRDRHPPNSGWTPLAPRDVFQPPYRVWERPRDHVRPVPKPPAPPASAAPPAPPRRHVMGDGGPGMPAFIGGVPRSVQPNPPDAAPAVAPIVRPGIGVDGRPGRDAAAGPRGVRQTPAMPPPPAATAREPQPVPPPVAAPHASPPAAPPRDQPAAAPPHERPPAASPHERPPAAPPHDQPPAASPRHVMGDALPPAARSPMPRPTVGGAAEAGPAARGAVLAPASAMPPPIRAVPAPVGALPLPVVPPVSVREPALRDAPAQRPGVSPGATMPLQAAPARDARDTRDARDARDTRDARERRDERPRPPERRGPGGTVQ